MSSPPSAPMHLSKQIAQSRERVTVQTRYGPVIGGRALDGAVAFLETPYALPPDRFTDPVSLPADYKYSDGKEHVYETAYAAQPYNDGQAAGVSLEDKLGLGKPSENPLFLNIVIPSSFNPSGASAHKFPVKIYIHGGFLQFGSPHSLSAIETGVSATRNEVWVNAGYRLSAFGFLAGETAFPGSGGNNKEDIVRLTGNYGFRDLWCAMHWIRENIAKFGGDDENITVTGLSAGAHAVHQLLHRAACEALYLNKRAPFDRAVMQSNAILSSPKRPSELTPQLLALLSTLDLITSSHPSRSELTSAISALRSPEHVPASALVEAIERLDTQGLGTFRGCLATDWVFGAEREGGEVEEWDHVDRQTNGDLARGLRKAGVKSVVVGEMSEEWYLYAIAHEYPQNSDRGSDADSDSEPASPEAREKAKAWAEDVVSRYIPRPLAERYVEAYEYLLSPANADVENPARLHPAQRLAGYALSAAQVYVPVRRFEMDLRRVGHGDKSDEGVSIIRYVMKWAPEAAKQRVFGYTTHGTDRAIWTLSTSLSQSERDVAKRWLDAVASAVQDAEADARKPGVGEVLVLDGKGNIGWKEDAKSEELKMLGLL